MSPAPKSKDRLRVRFLSLTRLLQDKGVISTEEVTRINNTDDLITLLEDKGLIQPEELQELILDNTVLIETWFDLIVQEDSSDEAMLMARTLAGGKYSKVFNFIEGLVDK